MFKGLTAYELHSNHDGNIYEELYEAQGGGTGHETFK